MNIESASIRMMAVDGRRISAWMNMPFNPQLVIDGRVKDPDGLAAVLKNSVERLGINAGTVAAVLPSPRVTSRVMTLPPVRGM